eukprot:scaffold40_cov305-Pinguiococcus_pyrenoidosus.AAC.25
MSDGKQSQTGAGGVEVCGAVVSPAATMRHTHTSEESTRRQSQAIGFAGLVVFGFCFDPPHTRFDFAPPPPASHASGPTPSRARLLRSIGAAQPSQVARSSRLAIGIRRDVLRIHPGRDAAQLPLRPTQLTLVDAGREAQAAEALSVGRVRGRKIHNHQRLAVAAQRRLQQLGQLRVSEGHVPRLVPKRREDVREAAERPIDVLRLLQPIAGGSAAADSLAPREVDQVQRAVHRGLLLGVPPSEMQREDTVRPGGLRIHIDFLAAATDLRLVLLVHGRVLPQEVPHDLVVDLHEGHFHVKRPALGLEMLLVRPHLLHGARDDAAHGARPAP